MVLERMTEGCARLWALNAVAVRWCHLRDIGARTMVPELYDHIGPDQMEDSHKSSGLAGQA